ncbi:unnamed protein product [Jaminaea pallidilutea]
MMAGKGSAGLLFIALVSLVIASVASAASAFFTDAKFSLTTVDGSSRLSEPFTPKKGVEALQDFHVDSDEILRIGFTLTSQKESPPEPADSSEEQDSKAASSSSSYPDQVVIQLVSSSPSSPKVVGFVPSVSPSNGKVTWSQRVDRLSPSALATPSGQYIVRLLIASSASSSSVKPLSLDLGSIVIPSLAQPNSSPESAFQSSPAREQKAREMGFFPWEERRHTFRKDKADGAPGAKKSLIVLGVLVTVPWVVLAGLLIPLLSGISLRGPRTSTTVLLASLLFLETLAVRYYRGEDGFGLFKMLPYFIAGAAVAASAVVGGALDGVGLKSWAKGAGVAAR